MTFRPIVVLFALQFGVVPAFAQRDDGFQRRPSQRRDAAPAPTRQDEQGARTRERQAPPARRESDARRAEPADRQPEARREGSAGDGDRVAVQRGRQAEQRRLGEQQRQAEQRRDVDRRGDDRPRFEVDQRRGVERDRDRNPRVAVPRQGPPPRSIGRSSRSDIYIVRPPAYRYTPRFSRPYVYGALGPGYFYYGSYGWYPRASYFYDRGYFGRGYGYDVGEVRLRVEPRWAEVWVDGYFAGTVDDFDGTFQSLRLESGPYHLEIVAPGYETLEVDLRVSPGQKITYRGELRREF